MDAVRAGGNCLIIHLVASMDMHCVRPVLRKTKEQHVYIRGCAYPTHTNYKRIGLHVGFYQVTGHFKNVNQFLWHHFCPLVPFCIYSVHFVLRVAKYVPLIVAATPYPALLVWWVCKWRKHGSFCDIWHTTKTRIKTSESLCNNFERQ